MEKKSSWLANQDLPGVATKVQVTTCVENLEMSSNLTAIREISGILLKIRGGNLVRESCLKLCIVLAYLCSYRYLVGVYSVLNIKYMVSDHALLHSYPTTDSNTSAGMI